VRFVLTPHQAETQLPNRVEPQTEMDNPGQLETALTRVRDAGQAVIQKQDSDRDELMPQMGWFFQLADGCRLLLPEFFPPRWP
jgi:hypothetical protein